ncbi:hypothetical protein, partial [Paraburkholderia sp. SIMBA_054]|uniref:hypothetical protein n=1 Tax=Paraburkholderia sp. SIMBA_054 TaxID=3085795 RepID=UPI00397D9A1C
IHDHNDFAAFESAKRIHDLFLVIAHFDLYVSGNQRALSSVRYGQYGRIQSDAASLAPNCLDAASLAPS